MNPEDKLHQEIRIWMQENNFPAISLDEVELNLFNEEQLKQRNEFLKRFENLDKLIKFEDYKLMHNFLHPDEQLKSWITGESYYNYFVDSWSELMKVISKISNLEEHDIDVSKYFTDRDNGNLTVSTNGGVLVCTDINEAYNEAIQFIKFYNQL